MPRKTGTAFGRPSTPRDCFNEAAARCRGKPQGYALGATIPSGASMRPRPDAAENRTTFGSTPSVSRTCFNEAAARCRGKPV